MGRWRWAMVVVAAFLVACDSPTDPCAVDGPASGIPFLDVVTALQNAGAEVEDRGELLETTLMGVAARDLRVNEHEVRWHEYCTASVAGQDAARFSSDASTFQGIPLVWDDTPHVYVQAQVILIYQGEDAALLVLLEEVMGAPVAEG